MLDIVVFAAFLLTVVLVGLVKSHGGKGSEGYFLAGRGLSWWLIGLSLIAANISTEQFVGMSGGASGLSGFAIASYEWMAAITLVFVAFFFLPVFLRSGVYTVPQFLEYRFDALSRTVMSLMMVVVLVCVNTAAVIYSAATVADTVFASSQNIPFKINTAAACWTIGVIAAFYVCMGGLKACAWVDLLQGSALIIGGGLIAYFSFEAFSVKPVSEISTTIDFSKDELAKIANSGLIERFFELNSNKLTLFLPADHPELPWTTLVVGMWIPHFYYWGFNQYIVQKTLGASSLAEGQKGIMLAAWLKVLTPFIIVIPGIMAFNLFAPEQRDAAERDQKIASTNAKAFSPVYFDWLDKSKQRFDPDRVARIFTYSAGEKDSNGALVKKPIFTSDELTGLYADYERAKKSGELGKITFNYDKGWAQSNSGTVPGDRYSPKYLVDQWNAKNAASADPSFAKTLYGYKYDSAFGLLISKVLPEGFGLRGFIIAALLGAVVSSLAAMLNAASTIFTIDIYKKFLHPSATEKIQVAVGRISVLVFAAVGCIVAPMLANPRFGGIFIYIQEFQGYLSPGILAVFVFGMFSKRAPRFAGALGIITGPIVYGLLQYFCGDIAFMNRIAITFACSLAVMFLLTFLKPLKRDIVLPVNGNMDLRSSRGAKIAGTAVITLMAVFYTSEFWL